ncbi:hypothetical protein DAT35_06715 [Vitiosangium sp. GDMCC 1.1324]|nr:hypothetical protein DAT35_06715 [Vitiosangium sp. GDMCC 1.1324]
MKCSSDAYIKVDVWQAPDSSDADVRILMETHVDVREFCTPYQLRLEMREGTNEMTLTLDDITFP